MDDNETSGLAIPDGVNLARLYERGLSTGGGFVYN